MLASILFTACLVPALARGETWPAPLDSRTGTNWAAVSWSVTGPGFEGQTGGFRYYVIRRSDGGAFQVVGTVFTGSMVNALGGRESPVGTRTFWDRGLTAGKAYGYTVTAVVPGTTPYSDDYDACRLDPGGCVAAGVDSTVVSSPVFSVTVTGGSPFGTVFTESGNGWVKLKWSANAFVSEAGVSIYRIYRASVPSPAAWTAAEISNVENHVDTGLVNLVTYRYVVFPCCPERAPSFAVATPFVPAVGQGVPDVRTDASAGVRAVRLSWLPAVPGSYPLVAYAVFRSDNGGTTFLEVGRVPATALAFVDAVPRYGQRYFYVIRPVDSAGNLGYAYVMGVIDVELPANRVYLNRNSFRPDSGQWVDVAFQVTEPGRVRISIFTLTGDLVRRLYDRRIDGNFTPDAPFNSLDSGLSPADTRWDGANGAGELVRSGAYFVVLEMNGERDVRSVAVIR